MRRRTLCGGKAVTSTKPVLVNGSKVPPLNEDNVAVLKASLDSNHDMADVREDVSNRSSHDYLDDDNMYWNFSKSCFSCNEGGEVLVCAERDCPINLHAKCLCTEPKFDDKGNFYCPYCWYKRAWAEVQESREKALLAKKDLSKFFFQNGITSDKLAENDLGVKTREPRDVSVMGNRSGLDYHNRPGNKSVHSHPLKTLQDQQKEGERLMAGTDQHGIVVEDIANANETRFVGRQEEIKLEDLRYNNEYAHAMIAEDVKPLSAFRFGECTDVHLPNYAFAKGVQEGVEVYVDKDRVKDREKLVQNELNLSATDCSVSGTADSDSEPLPMKESHVKQEGVQRTSYTREVPSFQKSLPQKSRTESKNACYENEEVVNSPQRSSMRR